MKIRIGRWFVVAVVRWPGASEPACIGFGLDASRAEARRAAVELAAELT